MSDFSDFKLADDFLRPLLVVPEIGRRHPGFDVGFLLQLASVVKESP